MGLDITVLGLDWAELERVPPSERDALLYEAAAPDDDPPHPEPEVGWMMPASPRVPWSGRYEFAGTLGSYKPHFWAAHGWDTVRAYADPALRAPLDGFLGGLIWWGEEEDEDEGPDPGVFPSDVTPWRPNGLVVPPPAVPGLIARWAGAEPLLEGLREAYDRHAARDGWIRHFGEFTALLRQWAVVLTEADRRGWGLIGLH